MLFALTFWLASFDWMMSFGPHWYSTIFGIYRFASLFTAWLFVRGLGRAPVVPRNDPYLAESLSYHS